MFKNSVGIFLSIKVKSNLSIYKFYIVIKSVLRNRRLSWRLRKRNNICNKLRNIELQYKTTCAYICKRQLSEDFDEQYVFILCLRQQHESGTDGKTLPRSDRIGRCGSSEPPDRRTALCGYRLCFRSNGLRCSLPDFRSKFSTAGYL